MMNTIRGKSRSIFLRTLLSLICVGLLFCGSIAVYQVSMERQFRSQAFGELEKVCQDVSESITGSLEQNYSLLEAAADFLAGDVGFTSDVICRMLRSVAQSGNFYLVGISDRNGMAYTSMDRTVDISDRLYWSEAMEGRRGIERVEIGKLVGEARVILSAPVSYQGEVRGVIYGSYELRQFDQFLQNDAFGGQVTAYILNRDASLTIAKGTLAEDWRGEWADARGNTAQTFVARHISGSMELLRDGKTYYLYAQPMDTASWMLVTVAPKSLFHGQYSFINKNVSRLVSVLVVIVLIATTYLLVESNKARREITDAFDQLAFFNDNLPGCVFQGELNPELTLRYTSDGFCELTGYTNAEFQSMYNREFVHLLEPEDVEQVKNNVTETLRRNGWVKEEYRVRRKDGGIRWVFSRYRLASKQGEVFAYGVITDITETVLRDREMELLRRKYQIALEHTEHTFVEYDPFTQTLWCDHPKATILGLEKITYNVPESLIESGWIRPGSVKDCRMLYQRIRGGDPYASAELEVSNGEGCSVWLRLDMTNLFDEQGKYLRTVSIVQNVTKARQAEKDPLTGLLNRASFESQVRRELEAASGETKYAFLALDVDYFKAVNDTLGHFTGDQLLQSIADVLRRHFRSSDLLARMGGDEFAVLMRSVGNEKAAVLKMKELIRAVSEISVDGSKPKISISGGIAFAPKDGNTFETLYTRADVALYQAKDGGRGKYCVYHGEVR